MIQVSTRDFERAVSKLARSSLRSDADLITSMGRITLRSLNYNTPIRRRKGQGGAVRAGWWSSWTGLDMSGQPVKRALGRQGRYDARGDFIDNRRSLVASVTLVNGTRVLNEKTKEWEPLTVDLNRGRHGAKNKGFVEKGLDEAAGKIAKKAEREYRQLIRRANRSG